MQGQSLYAADGPNLGPEMTDPHWVVVCRATHGSVGSQNQPIDDVNATRLGIILVPPARCPFDSLNGWEDVAFYASLVDQRGKDRRFGFVPLQLHARAFVAYHAYLLNRSMHLDTLPWRGTARTLSCRAVTLSWVFLGQFITGPVQTTIPYLHFPVVVWPSPGFWDRLQTGSVSLSIVYDGQG